MWRDFSRLQSDFMNEVEMFNSSARTSEAPRQSSAL